MDPARPALGVTLHVRYGRISAVDVHGDWSNALKAGGLEA
jgi:hypothetical protein